MKCRKNVAQLSPDEKSRLVQAFLDLKNPAKSPSQIPDAQTAVTNGGGSPNRYDDYVWMHNTVGFGAHRGPAFGPWHREFLYQIEFDLQQVSGDAEMTIPYWDWTTARTSASAGWPFTNDFMGGFGNAGPGATTGFVTTGPFSNPATWRINIRRAGDADLTLKRSRGVPSGTQLPERDDVLFGLGVGVAAGTTWPSIYDLAPWNDTNAQPTSAEILASFRKYLERLLHDGIHVWIGDGWELNAQNQPTDGGHMTFPSVAVNDPIFWLHHCNVDRLWSIWQRKAVTPGYLPQALGTATNGHHGGDAMVKLSTPAWFNTSLHQHPNDVQDHQALDYWFHTDIPEITLDTPSVSFGTVPELLTTFMPATFSVRTCQPVTFEITQVIGANFSEPVDQGVVVVDHEHATDMSTARLYVQYQALGPLGTPQAGTATVVASIVDTDGYDTVNAGDPLLLGTWVINLTATPVARPRAAIGLVLDRSGSMGLSAGAAGSRYDLLKSSLAVVRDVMRPLDGVGVVTFDDVTATLNPITEMGPAVTPASPGTGRAALDAAIGSPDLVPRNTTGIGQGLIDGAAVLDAERLTAGTPYQRFGLCVMTDGNENENPRVGDPPVTAAIAPYSDGIYAIGLGRPGDVSDAVLTSISNYMLVTGDITAAERRFRLTKYFVQILAGITRAAIVVDPQGELHVGSEHRIPFALSEHDLEVDVIAVSPLAPLLELSLEAPDGTIIDGAFAAPTVELHEQLDDVFYRLSLPVAPSIPRAGRWTAIVRLTRDALRRHADDRESWAERLRMLADRGTLPYSVIVQSYSDLGLEVAVKPSLCLAGDKVDLFAALSAFGQPFTGRASMTAVITDPQDVETRVALTATGDGRFEGTFTTSFPGLHAVRFLATGGQRRSGRFQREGVRTVSAFRGELPKGSGSAADDRAQPPDGDQRRAEDRTPTLDERRITELRAMKEALDRGDVEAGDPATFGLAEQPSADAAAVAAEPARRTHPEMEHDEMPDREHDEHEAHDHQNMAFTMFRRTASGEVVELQPGDVERDTSNYDDEGRDRGVGPERTAPPPAGEGHGHDH